MKIAILGGTGSLGKGLASRWIKAGHDVLIGSRDLPKAQEIAVQLGLESSSGMLNIDAAKICELACLTVPFAHQESTLISIDDGLQNKIMIDATVPLMPPKVMIDCDVLVAGDFLDARNTVIELAADAGLTGWHAGPLCNSVAAEALTSILIAINKKHSLAHSGIKITGH